jgi:hypothetical protein
MFRVQFYFASLSFNFYLEQMAVAQVLLLLLIGRLVKQLHIFLGVQKLDNGETDS